MLKSLRHGLTGRGRAAVRHTSERHAAVACVTRNSSRSDGSLEVLFILRSRYQGDRWSGQIAFPGGKQEEADRCTRDTAERETREELGIDISGDAFEYLGRLDDAWATKKMAVSCYVYHQTAAQTPPFVLSSGEVERTHWVDLRHIADKANSCHVEWPEEGRPLPFRSMSLLGIQSMHFRGVDLGGPPTGASSAEEEEKGGGAEAEKLVLWGLTLRFVTMLLQSAQVDTPHLVGAPAFRYKGANAALHSINNAVHVATSKVILRVLGLRLPWLASMKLHVLLMWSSVAAVTGFSALHVVRMSKL